MSERPAYRAMAKVFSIVLLLASIAAFAGWQFSHNYVRSQLNQEKITMPAEAGIASLPDEAKNALKPFAGKPLDNGDAAQAYANHFIWEHMQSACKAVKTSDGKTLTIPADQCTYSGIGDFTTKTKADLKAKGMSDADINKSPEVVALNAARDSNFKGDSLRSMLLTAYAFWLIGDIAKWAALACLLGAILLGLLGWFLLNKKHNDTVTTHATVTDRKVVGTEPVVKHGVHVDEHPVVTDTNTGRKL